MRFAGQNTFVKPHHYPDSLPNPTCHGSMAYTTNQAVSWRNGLVNHCSPDGIRTRATALRAQPTHRGLRQSGGDMIRLMTTVWSAPGGQSRSVCKVGELERCAHV